MKNFNAILANETFVGAMAAVSETTRTTTLTTAQTTTKPTPCPTFEGKFTIFWKICFFKNVSKKYSNHFSKNFKYVCKDYSLEEQYSLTHNLMFGPNAEGPPVIVNYSTVVVLPKNETRTIHCYAAGAKYYLWDFPNGDYLSTSTSNVSKIP